MKKILLLIMIGLQICAFNKQSSAQTKVAKPKKRIGTIRLLLPSMRRL
jgi:hypothetical protein